MTWTDCDTAGDYVVPNVLSPRDLVSRPDNMDKTLLHSMNKCLFAISAISHLGFKGRFSVRLHQYLIISYLIIAPL